MVSLFDVFGIDKTVIKIYHDVDGSGGIYFAGAGDFENGNRGERIQEFDESGATVELAAKAFLLL